VIFFLDRLLFIYELVKYRARRLLLPTSDYDNGAIRGDKIVAWSASSESITPLSLWDSTSKTLEHFRGQKSYNDFTVTRHADESILLSGIGSLRASGSIKAKHYDRDGTLSSSQSVTCPKHPILNTYHSRNEFSRLYQRAKSANPSRSQAIDFPEHNRK
jgi:hypothetical protein